MSAPSIPVPRLVLASASPARLQTLRSAGLRPEVVVSGVNEAIVDEPDPALLALRLAQLKAVAVAANTARALVIGCDSVLQLGSAVHGKPCTPEEAVERWQEMRGHVGVLHTGHCVIDTQRDVWLSRSAATRVRFAEVSDEEIAAYVATGEPLRVAGAFTLDGLGVSFCQRCHRRSAQCGRHQRPAASPDASRARLRVDRLLEPRGPWRLMSLSACARRRHLSEHFAPTFTAEPA